jgi:hypothetical protein
LKLQLKQVDKADLKVLQEKEIQERLYGQYKPGSSPAMTHAVLESDSAKIDIVRPNELSTIKKLIRRVNVVRFGRSVMGSFHRIPWRFALFLAIIVGLSTFAFLTASVLFEARNSARSETRSESNLTLPYRPAPEQVASQEVVAPTTESALSSASGDPEKVVSKPPSARANPLPRRTYGVQVCTYQRESDANRLTRELTAKNFKAFYRKMQSRNQSMPYYVVFLGEKKTFDDAKTLLQKFQKTDLHTDFSDSFIRSL